MQPNAGMSPQGQRIVRILLGLLIAFYAMVCLRGIANEWPWGHHGFNGAAFSHAARNSLRFGVIGQAQYHMGDTPPPPEAFYTHHPMALHFHLIAAQWAFGDRPWVGRMVPATYSFFAFLALLLLAYRYFNPPIALLTALLFLLTPLNLAYANMINHEQGCLFWCLILAHASLAWSRSRSKASLALALVAVSFAGQFDWSAYVYAFVLALAMSIRGLRSGGTVFRWRPEYLWVALFSLVVLANFFGFIAFISWLRGTGDLVAAFGARTEALPDYPERLQRFLLELIGPLGLSLLGLWLLLGFRRLFLRRLNLAQSLVFAFVVVQCVRSGVFKHAGYFHAYWLFYFGPAVALGGAEVLWVACRVFFAGWARIDERWGESSPAFRGELLHDVAPLFVAALLCVFQGPKSLRMWEYYYRSGGSPEVADARDGLEEARFAKAVAARFAAPGVSYWLHSSVQRPDIQIPYYLDAPFYFFWDPRQMVSPPGKGCGVVLADLDYVDAVQREGLFDLVRRRGGTLWERHFLAIPCVRGDGRLHSYVPRAQPSSWWSRWFVHWRVGPISWQLDPEPKVAWRVFEARRQPLERSADLRSLGLPIVSWDCPPGQILGGVFVGTRGPEGDDKIQPLRALCRAPHSRTFSHGPWFGPWPPLRARTLRCRPDELLVGLTGRYDQWLLGLGLECASLDDAGRPTRIRHVLSSLPKGGQSFEIHCPPGRVASGLRVPLSLELYRVGLACTRRESLSLGERWID